MKEFRGQKGFSLMEVMVACSLVALILGVLGVKFMDMAVGVRQEGECVMEVKRLIEHVKLGQSYDSEFDVKVEELERVGDPVIARWMRVEVYDGGRVLGRSEFVR